MKGPPKKYIVFLSVVGILIATSLIQMPCPICEGTGKVSIMPGAEEVDIIEIDSRPVTQVVNICEMWILFQYDVTIRLSNAGLEDLDVWLKLVLRDYSKGRVLDTQYVTVHIPAQAIAEVDLKVWFRTGVDVPTTTEIYAETVTDSVPDNVCTGRGVLPFNLWLLVSSLQAEFEKTSPTYQDFSPPPPFYPPADWAE